MDLYDIDREMARLDAIFRPVAKKPVDLRDPDAWANLGANVRSDLANLGVEGEAPAVVAAIVELYAGGDDTVRVLIRELFDRYTSFRWAAHLPREWHTGEELRARLIHLSARDQGADTRDEIVSLKALCDKARRLGIDVDPIIDEVAAMSSEVDRCGMGSMRDIFITYGKDPTPWS
jgi:hypothetical protein